MRGVYLLTTTFFFFFFFAVVFCHHYGCFSCGSRECSQTDSERQNFLHLPSDLKVRTPSSRYKEARSQEGLADWQSEGNIGKAAGRIWTTESHDPKRVATSEEFRLTAATNVAALGETQVSARLSLITKPSSALVEEDEQKFSGITPFF